MSESDLNSTTNYALNFKAVQGVVLRRHRKNTHINGKNYSPVYWSGTAQHLRLGNLLPRTNQAAQAKGKGTGGDGRVRPVLPGGCLPLLFAAGSKHRSADTGNGSDTFSSIRASAVRCLSLPAETGPEPSAGTCPL